MAKDSLKFAEVPRAQSLPTLSTQIGLIESIGEDGVVFVSTLDGEHRPALMLAHVASSIPEDADLSGKEVVLLLSADPKSWPIISGIVASSLHEARFLNSQSVNLSTDSSLEIEATKSIALRCGKATLTMKESGEVTLKGTRVTSRARATNRLQGATVKLN